MFVTNNVLRIFYLRVKVTAILKYQEKVVPVRILGIKIFKIDQTQSGVI